MGEDQIPPKFIKTAGNFPVEPLTDIINSCFSSITLPDLAKRVIIINIFTQTTDLSVLNTFSKVIEYNTIIQYLMN